MRWPITQSNVSGPSCIVIRLLLDSILAAIDQLCDLYYLNHTCIKSGSVHDRNLSALSDDRLNSKATLTLNTASSACNYNRM